MSYVVTAPGLPLVVGDFNFHINQLDEPEPAEFLSLCASLNLVQHVTGPTHRSGNTLDLVLTRSVDNLVKSASSLDHGFPDHFPVFAHISLQKPKLPTKQITFRKIKCIDSANLAEAIRMTAIPAAVMQDLAGDDLAHLYNSQLRKVLDDLAPAKSRKITVRPECEWYSSEVREAKQNRRRCERAWRKSGLAVHHQLYIEQKERVSGLISRSTASYYKSLIEEHKGDTNKLFKVVNKLLGNKSELVLPSGSNQNIADMFSDYFVNKITSIKESIESDQLTMDIPPPQVLAELSTLQPVTEKSVEKIIKTMKSKSCELDPLPASLVKMALPELLPIITKIINQSVTTGTYPSCFKQALVTPLLKKPTLDPDINKNYRPVSNLSFVSKVLEKVVAAQLNDHLTCSNLSDPYQSAYRQRAQH
jgi:hypothetical protein